MKKWKFPVKKLMLSMGIPMIISMVLQALNRGAESLAVSLGRQLIFMLPVAWIFAQLVLKSQSGSWIIWTTFPIAELVTLIISYLLMRSVNRKIIAE